MPALSVSTTHFMATTTFSSVVSSPRSTHEHRDIVSVCRCSRSSARADGAAVSKRLDRQLVAVMFTDIVGYTALMQADERLGLDKRDKYIRALESHHDAFGGTIVKRMGDGTMSTFRSSLAAVLAAVAIQRELAAQEVPVRIGIHVGEVMVEPGDLLGDAVNIASRIESFAVAGGVMLSDSAYDPIKNRSEVGVVSLGRFRLKNVGARSSFTRCRPVASSCQIRGRSKARASGLPACRATCPTPLRHC
jgi:class 3 adenylate cyclase